MLKEMNYIHSMIPSTDVKIPDHHECELPGSFLLNYLLGIVVLLNLACQSDSGHSENPILVRTTAELMILHEQDKIDVHIPDSLYRIHVQQFFKEHGISDVTYRSSLRELQKDGERWRIFLKDVSVVVDSIKLSRHR